jgi:hypothetical protein
MPATPTARLAIVNPGHTCHYNSNPNQDNQTVIDLLNDGYAVLATYMPYYNPVQCGLSHDQLFDPASNFRPAGGAHPLIYFLDTVRRGLNYAIATHGYTEIKLTGLSGGGWTTTLYAALDPRITTGVTIAGSEPFTLRNPSDAEQEDVPSKGNDFFRFFRSGHQLVTGYTRTSTARRGRPRSTSPGSASMTRRRSRGGPGGSTSPRSAPTTSSITGATTAPGTRSRR